MDNDRMGLSSRIPFHARHRDGAHRRHDPRQAAPERSRNAALCCGLILGLIWPPVAAIADPLRIATYQVELSRDGPGLLVRDLMSGTDPQIAAVVAVIARADADVILLTDLDYDHGRVALTLLADALAAAGAPYPHRLALAPNTGVFTGLDLDGNRRLAEARDAMGYGRFAGDGGMAILSRLPIADDRVQDMSAFLWRDLPGALLPPDLAPDVARIQRLSSTAHWAVPLTLPSGSLTLMAWHASPPVFDGPEDRNGRRNHDEAAFWRHYLDGALPFAPPDGPFVLLGDANLDPADGEGRNGALLALLTDARLQDPAPRSASPHADPGQSGDPATDTAAFPDGPGALRVDYVLPSRDLSVIASGVIWPAPDDPLAATAAIASRHRLVWVDVALP
jgi:endonuclease/exonuclease/phosphatase family metal-dependent hydrolase